MKKSSSLRVALGSREHLEVLLALETSEPKPSGLFIVQSISAKIRKQSAIRLAKAMGKGVYQIQLAAVTGESSAETEQKLNAILSSAEQRDALVFFDEADALFGKRDADLAKVLRAQLAQVYVCAVAGTLSFARSDRYWQEGLLAVLHEV